MQIYSAEYFSKLQNTKRQGFNEFDYININGNP